MVRAVVPLTRSGMRSGGSSHQAGPPRRAAVIIVVDFAGMVRGCNVTAELLFGWSEQELLGRPPRFLDDAQHERFARLVERAFDGETTRASRWSCTHRDGHTVPAAVAATPALGEDGRIRRALLRITADPSLLV